MNFYISINEREATGDTKFYECAHMVRPVVVTVNLIMKGVIYEVFASGWFSFIP